LPIPTAASLAAVAAVLNTYKSESDSLCRDGNLHQPGVLIRQTFCNLRGRLDVDVQVFLESNLSSEDTQREARAFGVGKEFAFVFVSIGLLVFYILNRACACKRLGRARRSIFTAGNIVIEALLLL
jgi:hypothetical protein